MIDTHSHLLYGVDDGAADISEAQQLLQESVLQGVTTIVLTPHYRKGMFETANEKVVSHFNHLAQWASQELPELSLLLGREIYWSEDTYRLIEEGKLSPIGTSEMYLIEFSGEVSFQQLFDAVQSIQFMGKRVMIAHIERYTQLAYQKEAIQVLREIGCVIQVNAASVLRSRWRDGDRLRKKRARWLLREGLIDVIASDAHHIDRRPILMKQAYNVVEQTFGQAIAHALFIENPNFVINGGIL